jgi:hypothetical protein
MIWFSWVMRQRVRRLTWLELVEEICDDNLSLANWGFPFALGPKSISPQASFDQSLHLYSTNTEVDIFNRNGSGDMIAA